MGIHQSPRLASAGLFLLASAGASAMADTVELLSSQDTMLIESSDGSLGNGAGQYTFAGKTGQFDGFNIRRGVIAFDVAAAVPPGSTITSVSLQLRVSNVATPAQWTIGLHAITQAWGEGASAAPAGEGVGTLAEDGDATWLYTFYDTADPTGSPAWTTPGGDFVPNPSATTSVGATNQFATWGPSVQLIADVQQWVDAPASNHGWLLLGDESTDRTAKRFNTREFAGSSDFRPKLTIEFTPGEVTGACCLPAGDCVTVTTEVDCVAQGGLFQGLGTECGTADCPEPAGACCLPDGSCIELPEADCLSAGGEFQGDFTDCGSAACPLVLEPFVDELPIPPVAVPTGGVPGGVATYDIAMREAFQVLHRDLPPSVVWAYDDGVNGPVFPGPTIVATANQTVTVNWTNDLRYSSGPDVGELRAEHVLPVDLCMHGPNHMGPTARTVVHLHGAHVQARYDGYPENTWLPGEGETYIYSNRQLGGTLWYHDHALGITRLNVIMGLAGAYVLRDENELALVKAGQLPSGEFDVPLILQDRTVDADGALVYPAEWQDHYFGEFAVVNGRIWPNMTVRPGAYRFRLVGGANSRTFDLGLSNGAPFTVIGSDGGLLDTPVVVSEISLSPGERIEVVVDFSGYPDGTEIILTNANMPSMPGAPALPEVMRFTVSGGGGAPAALPKTLRENEVLLEADSVATRDFVLRREAASAPACADAWWLINGLVWDDIVERPVLGTTEIWRFVNPSGQVHPMHMHLVSYQVLDHTPVSVAPDGTVTTLGPPVPPGPTETGWKDTVQVQPGTMTRVIARFEDYTGKFAYHCHILEHEDHEMMRQFQVGLPCPADGDRDGSVDFDDLLGVLSAWGGCPEPCSTLGEVAEPDTCPADTNRDCQIDFTDLLSVLAAWGPCDG